MDATREKHREANYPNEMTYSGNHVFHYTTFGAAIKIIQTGTLKFGFLKDMNDIAESGLEPLDDIDSKTLERIVAEYQFISLTADCRMLRGFAMDNLWGYYAEKGNGVCLAFDKKKLFAQYDRTCRCEGCPDDKRISYIDETTNLVIAKGETMEEIQADVERHIHDIFYVKALCWQPEREIRLLTKSPAPGCWTSPILLSEQ